MNFDVELVLFNLIILTGIITLVDIYIFSPRRKAANITHMPVWIDYGRSFFPILIVVLILRAFLYEPFRIPSGSLEPTLLINDFILVNKYTYGIRMPILHNKIISRNDPQRGDIVVFRWPPKPSINYIKRVVGLPGDHVQYENKILKVNGSEVPQNFIDYESAISEDGSAVKVEKRQEILGGVKHFIYVKPNIPETNFDYVVPKGNYFVMGDNRDDSSDSRFWGFLPEENLIGKATAVWMSWDNTKTNMRWSRLATAIH